MKILIQQTQTGRLLSRLGDWTDDSNEAISFASTVAAVIFTVDQRLTNIQFVLRFSLPEYDIILPFGAMPEAPSKLVQT